MRKCVAGTLVSCWILAGLACKNTSASGSEILSKDTMRAVLWEMFEADAYNETRAATDTNFRHDSAFATLYTDIFRIHHVTREQFQDSYDYYMLHPEVLRGMIDTLTDRTNRALQKNGEPPMGHPAGFHNFTPPGGGPTTPFGPNGHPTPGGPRPLPGFPRRPGGFPPGQPGSAPPAGTPSKKPPPAQKGKPPVTPRQKNPELLPVQ